MVRKTLKFLGEGDWVIIGRNRRSVAVFLEGISEQCTSIQFPLVDAVLNPSLDVSLQKPTLWTEPRE